MRITVDTIWAYLEQTNHWAVGWVAAHLSHIATAFTAALLVIFGDDVNRFVKNRLRSYPFAVRAVAFLLLCSFGYGLLAALLTPSAARLIYYFGERYAGLVVLCAFVAIGLLAERKRYM
jgi:hypothetical protein